jgi:nucleotide-binding universal stress UspA family protein
MKILVALDGSDAAFNAMRSSCSIAAKTNSYITAFFVNKGTEYSPEETGWTSIKERISRELESFGHEIIHKAYQVGKEFGVPVEGIISDGIPAPEITKYVDAHGIIKLVAMGHSSKGRGAQEFVESTAKNIVATSKVPVFVTSKEINISNILIAVDDSEASKKIAGFGGSLARSLGASLGIISFVPDSEAIIDEYRLIAEVPNIERHIEASEKTLAEIIERATTAAIDVLNTMDIRVSSIVKKVKSDEIISEMSEHDLLIVGVKGGPSQKKLSRIANKILNSHEISTIFVQ